MGWLKASDKEREVREGGRESMGQLNERPRERWVREEGRESTGWLKINV